MRLSQVLDALAGEPAERMSVDSILERLGDRSFAVLVVLLGLPNCLPMPPPIPAVSALLLILVALQIAVRRHEPWFPGVILRMTVASADLKRAVGRALPVVKQLERLSQPRWRVFGQQVGAVLSAILLGTMAVGMLTAAPFVGQVPYGLAVCLIGLGQVERDGVLVMTGFAFGCVGAAMSASFLYGLWVAIGNLV